MLEIDGQIYTPQLVIFDKDGTLIDFHLLWHTWFSRLLGELEMNIPFTEELRLAIAGTLGYSLANDIWLPEGPLTLAPLGEIRLLIAGQLFRFLDLSWNQAVALVNTVEANVRMNLPFANLVRPVGDVRGLLMKMRASGLLIAIATGDIRQIAEISLRVAKIDDLIDVLICADDGIPTKPAPDAVEEICRRLGVAPAHAIMVGDSVDDITMAHSAGMLAAVGVSSGASPITILVSQADVIIGDIQDIHIVPNDGQE
jgi:phosphoglycolate phosphatase